MGGYLAILNTETEGRVAVVVLWDMGGYLAILNTETECRVGVVVLYGYGEEWRHMVGVVALCCRMGEHLNRLNT